MNFPIFFISLLLLVIAFILQMHKTSKIAEGETTKFRKKNEETKKKIIK